ncbi:MAG TPA: ATP-binding protein, partial [Opitutaceae bacterium]|nr:ATP-binding protein [Opitutaceae bacterium]
QQNPAARDAYLWVLRNGREERFGAVTMADRDRPSAPERSPHPPDDPFFENRIRANGSGYVAAHAPVPLQPGAPIGGWLAIEYPAAIWTLQLDNARRNGASLVAMFAVFAAVGMGLMCRHAAETARQRRLERTQVADRAKSEFLAFLSHELRTPMQSILGRTELLRHAGATPQQAQHIEAMEREGAILLRLVTDLLDLGTIEAGRLQLRPSDVSLRGLLDAVVDGARDRATAKNLALRLETAPDVPDALHADDGRVRQILNNLVGNALKYTERGEVRLCVGRDPAATPEEGKIALAFTVADTGPGLPPEKIEELFKLFTRFDAGDTYRREGTGVGLALVRRLCEFMGGSVHAENRPAGGALFTVRLAFPRAKNPVPVVADDAIAPATTPPRASVPTDRRALVIDDNPAVCDWLRDALGAGGFEVETANDGETALQAAAVRYFHVALVDINLPGRDGIAVARELRRRQPAMRIIGCSAEAFAVTRDAALEAGMDAYLTKPVSLADLARAVSPAITDAGSADIFARILSPDTSARARARLVEEWPKLRGGATNALASGHCESLRQLGHYLHSTALLTGDTSLAALCQGLSTAATKQDVLRGRALVAELDALVERWSPVPAEKPAVTAPQGRAGAPR